MPDLDQIKQAEQAIADFVSHEARLIVEIDGGQHDRSSPREAERRGLLRKNWPKGDVSFAGARRSGTLSARHLANRRPFFAERPVADSDKGQVDEPHRD